MLAQQLPVRRAGAAVCCHTQPRQQRPRWLPARCPAAADAADGGSRSSGSAGSSSSGGGGSGQSGDVVRPTAQAAAAAAAPPPAPTTTPPPAAAPHSVDPAHAAPLPPSNPAGSTTGFSSYASLYKKSNSTQYARTAPGSGTASAAGAGSSSSSSSAQRSTVSSNAGVVPPLQPSSLVPPAVSPSPMTPPATSDGASSVEAAVAKAQAALAAAERSLGSLHTLRSAQLPGDSWTELLGVVRSAAAVAAAGALLVASHAFGLGWQWAAATSGALVLSGAVILVVLSARCCVAPCMPAARCSMLCSAMHACRCCRRCCRRLQR